MSNINRPSQIILNSKFRNTFEKVGDINYSLTSVISGATGARVNSFSTTYLAKLIQPNQAQLDFILKNAGTTPEGATPPITPTASGIADYSYTISLAQIQNNYYSTLVQLIDDINSILTNIFVDSSGQYNQDLKPVLAFDKDKFRISITSANPMIIQSNQNNFWYKLGFSNLYPQIAKNNLDGDKIPSIVPLNELYIQIDEFKNDTAVFNINQSNSNINIPQVSEIITFNAVSLADVFLWRNIDGINFNLRPNNYIGNIRVRLLNSIGQVVELDSDYKIVLDLVYG